MSFQYRLKTNPLMLFLFVVFFSVFSALSVWQVNRVYQKQAIFDSIQNARNDAAVEILNLSDQSLLQYRFYRAKANGRFLADQCLFVENVIFKGKPGLYIYCPFSIEQDERVLLVNMGWIPRPQNRLELPAYAVGTKLREIVGFVADPRSKPVVTSGVDKPNIELEKLWAYFDFDSLKKQSGLDFYPVELQLTSKVDDVLQRDWPEFQSKIGMHIGYAIHWAAFALVTLGLFIKFNVKKMK